MSRLCEDCQAPVRFVLLGRKEDGSNKWSPPLDTEDRVVKERKPRRDQPFVHAGYTVTETFTIHNCEARTARQARERRMAQEREARARTTEAAWVEALKYFCPRCRAQPDVHCKNLTDRRLGKDERDTRWPHHERLPFGWLDPTQEEINS